MARRGIEAEWLWDWFERARIAEGRSMTNKNHVINYVEFRANDLDAVKSFYGSVFGWTFQDWGPDYIGIHGADLDGGFMRGPAVPGGPLIVIHATNLVETEKAVVAAGGAITEPPFDFPGGRRFHFKDPAGNELAVWTIIEDQA